MIRSGLAALVAAFVFVSVPVAQAEQITIQCTETFSEAFEDSPTRGVLKSSDEPTQITIVLDTNTGEFDLGNTRGRFAFQGDSFVGIARRDMLSAVWDINRTTGEMMVLGHVIWQGTMVMSHTRGSCTGVNGALPF